MREGESKTQAAIFRRNSERAQKIALLLACSRIQRNELKAGHVTTKIDKKDMQDAIKLADWMARRLVIAANENVHENKVQDNMSRIESLIRRSGPVGITRSEIVGTREGQIPSRELQEAIDLLIEGGRVFDIGVGAHTGTGRPKSTYVTKDNLPR